MHARLEVERGRHTAQRERGGIAGGGVQVDESGRDQEPGGVQHAPSAERALGDPRDAPVRDRDPAYGVESGLGIDHAAAGEHEVGAFP